MLLLTSMAMLLLDSMVKFKVPSAFFASPSIPLISSSKPIALLLGHPLGHVVSQPPAHILISDVSATLVTKACLATS